MYFLGCDIVENGQIDVQFVDCFVKIVEDGIDFRVGCCSGDFVEVDQDLVG